MVGTAVKWAGGSIDLDDKAGVGVGLVTDNALVGSIDNKLIFFTYLELYAPNRHLVLGR